MTAVLPALDVLKKDSAMITHMDNTSNLSSSTIDWHVAYLQIKEKMDQLEVEHADLRAWQDGAMDEMDRLGELEVELEREEAEKKKAEDKAKKLEKEVTELKGKVRSLNIQYVKETAAIQYALDKEKAEHQRTKKMLVDTELGNDDLERKERELSTSYADADAKYTRVLEEKIILEQELIEKATVEEEYQRLKDELRDANEEVNILKEKLAAVQMHASISPDSASTAPSSVLSSDRPSASQDDLLDAHTSDLSSVPHTPAKGAISPISPGSKFRDASRSPLSGRPQRSSYPTPQRVVSPSSGPAASSLARSSTVPALSTPSHLPSRAAPARPTVGRDRSTASTTSTAGGVPLTATRSRGVQMVSEMRLRVKNLEQKIQSRVPRLRMGSISSKSSIANAGPPAAGPSSKAVLAFPSTPPMSRRSSSKDAHDTSPKSRSQNISAERETTPAGGSSPWVQVDISDSPMPLRETHNRRISNPNAPSSFRPPSYQESPTAVPRASNGSPNSGVATSRRSQSRLSISTEGRSSVSTNATTSTASSIPTPFSRPSTPTLLPVAVHNGAGFGLKRPTGPGSPAYGKRSPFGGKSPGSPPSKYAVPRANKTMRQISQLTQPGTPTHTRIGKPPAAPGIRKNNSEPSADPFGFFGGRSREQSRARSGTAPNARGRGA